MKDLYSENYKPLMKETEDNTKKWKDILCSWIGRINIVKMSILPKAVYKFIQTLSKYPLHFSLELEKIILKLLWNHKKPQRVKTIFRKNNKASGIMLSDYTTKLQ